MAKLRRRGLDVTPVGKASPGSSAGGQVMQPVLGIRRWDALAANAHLPAVQEAIRREITRGTVRVRPAPGGGITLISTGPGPRPDREAPRPAAVPEAPMRATSLRSAGRPSRRGLFPRSHPAVVGSTVRTEPHPVE